MKIKSLFFALCMVVASANAQFTFLDIAGASVESGTVVSFGQGQVGNPAGYYEFFVSNETSEAIFMKSELVSAENADGSSFEICFGLCYTDIAVGQKFPNNGSVFIDAGTQTPSGNHLVNTLDNDTPMEFVFRFTPCRVSSRPRSERVESGWVATQGSCWPGGEKHFVHASPLVCPLVSMGDRVNDNRTRKFFATSDVGSGVLLAV